jgi:benzodiazapine receptor
MPSNSDESVNERPFIQAGSGKDFAGLAGFILLCFAISALGAWITASSVGTWYQTLAKPAFNPPDWVFAPVWTTLFLMIAVSGWRVWRRSGFGAAKNAFSLYFFQLALNLLWSFLFFGAQAIGAAFVEIMVLLAAIVVTGIVFARHDRVAAYLLVPYAAWVAFATLLTGAIWSLN